MRGKVQNILQPRGELKGEKKKMNSQNSSQNMTKEDVIRVTILTLNNIMVPAGMSEQIGMPILGAVKNLRIVEEMIKRENELKEAEKEGEDPDEREAEIQ
jgi:hypothetical protein